MYGILAIHEVLHTIRLRGYGKDAIHEVCIQLDCVGMARCHTLLQKSSCRCSAGAFLCLYMFFIDYRERPLQSFEHLLNEVVDVALIASVGFLDATVGDDHANRCGFVTHEASKSGER